MKSTEEKKSLEEYLEKRNVSFFGYRRHHTPVFVSKKKEGRVKFFNLQKNLPKNRTEKDSVYEGLSEVREEKSEVYFLDHEAAKVLLSDFPASARYVCIKLTPRLSWLIALPGLFRRLMIGLVKIHGVQKIYHEKGGEYWLILEHMLTEVLHTRLSLSEDVGIERFLEHLKKEGVGYVILRFFEKLPELYREGGDIDILVSDEYEKLIKNFLTHNPGMISIDVWTVSRTTFNDVTYYPPAIAKGIIERAIDGPAGSRIPTPKDAFLALAYHVVYHKGPFAGVPSTLPNISVNQNPENDYLGTLERMAKDLNISMAINMESLDDYLHKEGWRPHLDTLAKIAPKNKWIWERFFTKTKEKEVGLGVFILKQKVLNEGLVDDILKVIEDFGSFKILQKKIFTDAEVQHVAKTLRGGVWRIPTAKKPDDYLPAAAVVVLDTTLARLRDFNIRQSSVSKEGIRQLKKELRRRFASSEEGNIVHATDNTEETHEYIPVCFPDEQQLIIEALEQELYNINYSFFTKIRDAVIFFPRIFAYQVATYKRKIKSDLLRLIMRV